LNPLPVFVIASITPTVTLSLLLPFVPLPLTGSIFSGLGSFDGDGVFTGPGPSAPGGTGVSGPLTSQPLPITQLSAFAAASRFISVIFSFMVGKREMIVSAVSKILPTVTGVSGCALSISSDKPRILIGVRELVADLRIDILLISVSLDRSIMIPPFLGFCSFEAKAPTGSYSTVGFCRYYFLLPSGQGLADRGPHEGENRALTWLILRRAHAETHQFGASAAERFPGELPDVVAKVHTMC
jgi:hypothetical protein